MSPVAPHPLCAAECCLALSRVPGAIVGITADPDLARETYSDPEDGLLHLVLDEEETADKEEFEIQWTEDGPSGPRSIFYEEALRRHLQARRAEAARDSAAPSSPAWGHAAPACPAAGHAAPSFPAPGHAGQAGVPRSGAAQGPAEMMFSRPPPQKKGDAWNPNGKWSRYSTDDSVIEVDLEAEGEAEAEAEAGAGADADDSMPSTSRGASRPALPSEASSAAALPPGDSTIDLTSGDEEEPEVLELTSVIAPYPAAASPMYSSSSDSFNMNI